MLIILQGCMVKKGFQFLSVAFLSLPSLSLPPSLPSLSLSLSLSLFQVSYNLSASLYSRTRREGGREGGGVRDTGQALVSADTRYGGTLSSINYHVTLPTLHLNNAHQDVHTPAYQFIYVNLHAWLGNISCQPFKWKS